MDKGIKKRCLLWMRKGGRRSSPFACDNMAHDPNSECTDNLTPGVDIG